MKMGRPRKGRIIPRHSTVIRGGIVQLTCQNLLIKSQVRNFYGTLRFLSKGIIQTPRGVVTLIPHTYCYIWKAGTINKPRQCA